MVTLHSMDAAYSIDAALDATCKLPLRVHAPCVHGAAPEKEKMTLGNGQLVCRRPTLYNSVDVAFPPWSVQTRSCETQSGVRDSQLRVGTVLGHPSR